MSVANDVETMPPRLGARARGAVVVDMASDVAVFGAVLALGALVVGVCAVVELAEWIRDERR